MLLEVVMIVRAVPVFLNKVFDDQYIGYRTKACNGLAIWAN